MGQWFPGFSFLPFSKIGSVFFFPHKSFASHKKNNSFGKFFYLQHKKNIEQENYYYKEEPGLIPTILSAPEPALNI